MDPRKAAKVTAPDLTRAFEEGSGGAGKATNDSPVRVYLTLLYKDQKGQPEVIDYPLDQLDVALHDLRAHLKRGAGHGAAIVIDTTPPEVLSQIEQ